MCHDRQEEGGGNWKGDQKQVFIELLQNNLLTKKFRTTQVCGPGKERLNALKIPH